MLPVILLAPFLAILLINSISIMVLIFQPYFWQYCWYYCWSAILPETLSTILLINQQHYKTPPPPPTPTVKQQININGFRFLWNNFILQKDPTRHEWYNLDGNSCSNGIMPFFHVLFYFFCSRPRNLVLVGSGFFNKEGGTRLNLVLQPNCWL